MIHGRGCMFGAQGWAGNTLRRPGDVRNVLMGKGGMEDPALGFSSRAGTAALGGTGSTRPGCTATCTPSLDISFPSEQPHSCSKIIKASLELLSL